MNDKICPLCKSKMIKFGSNISCTNNDCENFIVDTEDMTFVNFYPHGGIDKSYFNETSDFKQNDFKRDYDDFLFFSNRPDYITRFEFRKKNDFLEKDLFYGFKIAQFKRYLPNSEINLRKVEEKYELMSRGRDLEKADSESALDFYKSILNNKLFKNDYYIYRKIVKLEKDYVKQYNYILDFFKSGIFCDRYNYLWFLKKLHQLSDKIDIFDEDVDCALKSFKNYGFNKKEYQDKPCPIAEKISLSDNRLKVKTEKYFSLRQFRYELQEEFSILNSIGKYELSTPIYEDLILKYGFKKSDYFKSICRNYLRLKDNDNALRWIYGYFSKSKRINNPDDLWFEEKLNSLNVNVNYFPHNDLFFDYNENYLKKDDFKENNVEFLKINDYINKVKCKYQMILNGQELENANPYDAIDYYNSILNHEYFKNDYYVYYSLVLLYDKIGDYESEIDTIISFFKSGIYCDREIYLLFLYNLKRLSLEFVIYDYEIEECLKSFKEISLKNKHLQNNPVAIADRIKCKRNQLMIIQGWEFRNKNEISALNMEMELFESCGKLKSVNDILWIMINEYEFDDMEIYKQLCYNYRELNDVEGEMDVINYYLNNSNAIWNIHYDKWLNDRLNELDKIKNPPSPIKEPNIDILYENNKYFLNHNNFKGYDNKENEFIDKAVSKMKLRYEGWKLEYSDYEKAIEFYCSLLNNHLFDNDYYLYRRLVLLYERINDFEQVLNTIKEFFYSGIYCNRYQYIWFLHKIEDVSRVKYISDGEINECLNFFKENGFKNCDLSKNNVFLCERLYKFKNTIKVESPSFYSSKQYKYELREEVLQLNLNGFGSKSVSVLRQMIDNGCESSIRSYMRLCHIYREMGELDKEGEIIEKYLSSNRIHARNWFKNRLNQVNMLINENES